MSDESSSMGYLSYLSPVPPAIAPSLRLSEDSYEDKSLSAYFSTIEGSQMFDPRTLIHPRPQYPLARESIVDETMLLNSLFSEHSLPYRVTGLVGSGGFADVYKGFNFNNMEKIAVKLMMQHHMQHKDIRTAFLLEPILINNLNHPNIVNVYDYLISPRPLHVMEYVSCPVKGPEAKPVDDRFVLKFLQDMSALLSYFEQIEFMHSDIKPSNIRVTEDLEFKLMDFGGSVFLKYFEHDFLRSFTPTYASPEVIKKEFFSTLHDIYSFGKTLGTVLTGENLPVPAIFVLISEMYQTDLPWSLREIISTTTDENYRKRPSARHLAALVKDYESETFDKQVFRPTHIDTFWQQNELSPLLMEGFIPHLDPIIRVKSQPNDSRITTRSLKKRVGTASTPLV